MFYSSIWDGLLKLITLVIVMVGCASAARGQSDLVMTLSVVASFPIWIFVYRTWISTVASWLHGRLTLGAPISIADAKALRRLFQLDMGMHWIALKEVRKLPKSQRRDALMAALQELGPHRREMLF